MPGRVDPDRTGKPIRKKTIRNYLYNALLAWDNHNKQFWDHFRYRQELVDLGQAEKILDEENREIQMTINGIDFRIRVYAKRNKEQ